MSYLIRKLHTLSRLDGPLLDSITIVSSNEDEAIFVTNKDEVFKCGHSLTKLKILCNKKVQYVSISPTHYTAITQSGDLYFHFWQFNNRSASINSILKGQNIVSVVSGKYHLLCLDDKGNVWSFGSNIFGQLGVNEKTKRIKQIKKLQNIKQIAAGCFHSLALDENGIVYAWGANYCKQLGLENWAECSDPQPIKYFNGKHIVKITSHYFADQSAAVDKFGRIYMWGENKYGEVQTDDKFNYFAVKMVGNGTVLDVDVDCWSTIVQTPSGLYAWGIFGGERINGTKLKYRFIEEALIATNRLFRTVVVSELEKKVNSSTIMKLLTRGSYVDLVFIFDN